MEVPIKHEEPNAASKQQQGQRSFHLSSSSFAKTSRNLQDGGSEAFAVCVGSSAQ